MQNLFQLGLFLQVITPGRLESLVAGVVGLISVLIGWVALARSRKIGPSQLLAIVALVVALISIILSILHLARSTGGFGTGSGRLGAIVAMLVALTGMVLGGKALVRSRRLARGKAD